MNNRLDNVLRKIDKVVGWVSDVGMAITGVILFVMVFLVTIYVFIRFAGGRWFFVEEWVGYFLVLMAYLGCAYALRTAGHIRVDVVFRLLPGKVKLWMTALTSLLAFVMLVFFTERSINWISYTLASKAKSIFPSYTPMWIPSTFVTIGLVIFTIAMAMYLVRSMVDAARGIEEEKAKPRQFNKII